MYTEYTKQALDFLNKNNIKMTIRFVDVAYEPIGLSGYRNHYKFTIKTDKGSYTSDFYDSSINTDKNIKPSEYDILACLEKYDVGDFDDFCSEFGYEQFDDYGKRNKRVVKTYRDCKKQYEALCRILTDEQMEELREIQ